MLVIRNSQCAELIDANLKNIAKNLVPYMREFHYNATSAFEDKELVTKIEFGLLRARSWGFETKFGLSLFVALMFEVAPDFDTDPNIRAVLEDGSHPLDERLAGIEDALSERGWEQLAARRSPGAWEG